MASGTVLEWSWGQGPISTVRNSSRAQEGQQQPLLSEKLGTQTSALSDSLTR